MHFWPGNTLGKLTEPPDTLSEFMGAIPNQLMNICGKYVEISRHMETMLTNFQRICESRTLGNSLNVGLRTGYSRVRTAGGASYRR